MYKQARFRVRVESPGMLLVVDGCHPSGGQMRIDVSEARFYRYQHLILPEVAEEFLFKMMEDDRMFAVVVDGQTYLTNTALETQRSSDMVKALAGSMRSEDMCKVTFEDLLYSAQMHTARLQDEDEELNTGWNTIIEADRISLFSHAD